MFVNILKFRIINSYEKYSYVTTIYFFTNKRRNLVPIGPICAMRLDQTEHLPNNICIIRRIA
jgi:YHS domain-containing protein